MTDLNNIHKLSEAMRHNGGQPPSGGNPNRPVIQLVAGDLPAAIDQAEAVLRESDHNIYQYGNRLVTVVWDPIRVSTGGTEMARRLSELTVPAIQERLDLAVQFQKWNGNSRKYVNIDCPKGVAARYLSRDGQWNMPTLLGVVTAPTLRADGSVLEQPGYDDSTGLLFDPLGVTFPPVPQNPTKEQALEALARLKEPIALFPFIDGPAQAVALSGLLSAVSRRAVDHVPMHGYDAPVAGSGKSKLVDYVSVIVTGNRAQVIAVEKDNIRNPLAAAMLAGASIIALDNMEQPIGGELLNQVLTQSSVVIRIFHTLDTRTVPCGAIVFVTGNNLIIEGDTPRRTLVCRLDPKVERPELLEFDFDPVKEAQKNRAQFAVDALTVLRAYIIADQADKRDMPPPLGSFEAWSRLVRNALIWLGEADPVDVQEDVRNSDPKLLALRKMMRAWQGVIGENKWIMVRDVIGLAIKEEPVDPGIAGKVEGEQNGEHEIKMKRVNPELLEAVQHAVGSKEWNKTLGRWLLRHKDRRISVDGREAYFQQDPGHDGSSWQLVMPEDDLLSRGF